MRAIIDNIRKTMGDVTEVLLQVHKKSKPDVAVAPSIKGQVENLRIYGSQFVMRKTGSARESDPEVPYTYVLLPWPVRVGSM